MTKKRVVDPKDLTNKRSKNKPVKYARTKIQGFLKITEEQRSTIRAIGSVVIAPKAIEAKNMNVIINHILSYSSNNKNS